MHPSRLLYVGYSRKLLQHLTRALKNCEVIRSPGGLGARILIKSEFDYALFLMDEQLPGMKGSALALFTRGLRHRKQTPILIVQRTDGCGELAERIRHLLTREPPRKSRPAAKQPSRGGNSPRKHERRGFEHHVEVLSTNVEAQSMNVEAQSTNFRPQNTNAGVRIVPNPTVGKR